MLISIRQAAEIIGCPEQRVRVLIQQGQLGSIARFKRRSTYTVTDSQLAKWLGVSSEEIQRRMKNA